MLLAAAARLLLSRFPRSSVGGIAGERTHGRLQSYTPLHIACRYALPRVVARLLAVDMGGDPNVRTLDDGRTALHVVCAYPSTCPEDADARLQVLNLLLAWAEPCSGQLPQVNAVDFNGDTALHAAAAVGSRRLVTVRVQRR